MRRLKPYVMVLPLVFLTIIIPIASLMQAFVESLGYIPALNLVEPTLDYYRYILSSKYFINNLLYSVYISISATVLSTAISMGIAFLLVRSKNEFIKRISKTILSIGFILPYLYIGFLLILYLGKSGILSRILYRLGVIHTYKEFPGILYSRSGIAIILGFILKATPFITIYIHNSMEKINNSLSIVVKGLGGSWIDELKDIYMPLTSKSILWSSTIVLAYTIGAFEIPYLLGSKHIGTLSSTLYMMYNSGDIMAIPSTMALTIVLLIVAVIEMSIYYLILKRLLIRKYRI